jgi:hypothetical protein
VFAAGKPGVSEARVVPAETMAGIRLTNFALVETKPAFPPTTAGLSLASGGVSSANPGLAEAKPPI